MTAIQAESLPAILEGRDVIGKAKTGSGKTAAFGLGILSNIDVKHFAVQSLVLCPTRELADQVAKEVRKLARGIHNIKVLTLSGGTPFGPQKGSLEHGAHIIVGTPGRIEDHLRKGNLKLEHLRQLVLDEADRMLDSGFEASVNNIIACIPEHRQTLLFSATYSDTIENLCNQLLKEPLRVDITEHPNKLTIEQAFYAIDSLEGDDQTQRLTALKLLLLQHRPQSTLVFCNTKREV